MESAHRTGSKDNDVSWNSNRKVGSLIGWKEQTEN